MDQETLRLLIGTLGAVLAAFGAALIAGLWARQNSRRAISAAREAAQAEREASAGAEDAIWLRDAKQNAYTQFLEAAEKLVEAYYTSGADTTDHASLRIARGQLKIVGNPAVRKSAAKVISVSMALFNLGEEALTGNEFEVSVRLEELTEAIHDFIMAARADLGASTPEDVFLVNALDAASVAGRTRSFRRTFWRLGGGEEEEK